MSWHRGRTRETVPLRFRYLDGDPPLAFAHRGGATHPANIDLENSRLAFQTAVDLGYRYLETDVHVTRDGVLMAFHDDTLDRCTTGSGKIHELSYAQVREALIAGREPIPSLAELLVAWPEQHWNIDIKSERAIGPLIEVLREADAFHRVCVASFSEARVRRARALLGREVATAMGPIGVAVLRFVPGRWLRRRLLPAGVACAQVPHRFRGLPLVTERFLQRAHELGCQVHVWTIDDEATMVDLLELGVDGIITDRIDILRDVLIARGEWHAPPRQAAR
jgi:glycerophosphoryl diester phosphodiesterase